MLTLGLAIFNIIFGIVAFVVTYIKGHSNRNEDHRREWFRVLILTPSIDLFYRFFKNVEDACEPLRNCCGEKEKSTIEKIIQRERISLRQSFIAPIQVIDPDLYNKLLSEMDRLIDDGLIPASFDPGINLDHDPTYSSRILDPLGSAKADMLGHIFFFGKAKVQKQTLSQ